MSKDSYTITIKIPDAVLSPNCRAHWGKKARAKKIARDTTCAVALLDTNCDRPMWASASILVRGYFKSAYHSPDPDNLIASLKGHVDGLQDAGLVANDKGLRFETPVIGVDKKNPRIELVVTHNSATAGEESR